MRKILYGGVIILILCTSCVTKKKYLLAENGRLDALNLIDVLNDNLGNCEDENDRQSTRIRSLLADTAELGKSLRYCQTMLTSNISEKEKISAMLDR